MKNRTLAKKRRRSVIKTKTHKKGGGYFFKTKEEKELAKELAEIAKYNRNARKIAEEQRKEEEEEREAKRIIVEKQREEFAYWNGQRLEKLQESRLFQPFTQETIRRAPINPPRNQLPETMFWWQHAQLFGNQGEGN
jgi:hypothetical protein